MNSNQRSLSVLQKQVSFFPNAFTKCMGISYEDDIIHSEQPVSLVDQIIKSKRLRHLKSFWTLNQFGNERDQG